MYVAQYLSCKSFNVELIVHDNSEGSILTKTMIFFSTLLKKLLKSRKGDFIYIQRGVCFYPQVSLIFVILSKFVLKKKVIYDIDDGLFLKNRMSIHKIIQFSDAVFVGGHELLNYLKKFNRNTFLIPTSANLKLYHTHATKDIPIKIGFVGSPSTTPYLSLLEQPIAELSKTCKFELTVLSATKPEEYEKFSEIFNKYEKSGVFPNLILWSEDVEKNELKTLSIGLAPLTNGSWEKYKCGFKVINYMAAGIPPVASRIGEHCYIIKDGINGFLCTTNQEWTEKLKRLIDDEQLRKNMGLNARKTVEAKYSLCKNAFRINQILNELT